MKVLISAKLQKAFLSSHKNHNYSLNFLLSSIDLNTCSECLNLVEEFRLSDERVEMEIDKDNVKTIENIFGTTENNLIEKLLWVSMLFPEV